MNVSNEKSSYLKGLDIKFSSIANCDADRPFHFSLALFPYVQNMGICALTSGVLRDHIIEIIFKK